MKKEKQRFGRFFLIAVVVTVNKQVLITSTSKKNPDIYLSNSIHFGTIKKKFRILKQKFVDIKIEIFLTLKQKFADIKSGMFRMLKEKLVDIKSGIFRTLKQKFVDIKCGIFLTYVLSCIQELQN